MELDFRSYLGSMSTAVLIGRDPPPPHFGSYTRALLVSKDRRHPSLGDPMQATKIRWEPTIYDRAQDSPLIQ